MIYLLLLLNLEKIGNAKNLIDFTTITVILDFTYF
jgi:hypothetical protein